MLENFLTGTSNLSVIVKVNVVVTVAAATKIWWHKLPDNNSVFPDHNEKRDFERAVEQQVAFQSNPRMQKAITIYKNLMARIDPSDPTVRNIEMLRR